MGGGARGTSVDFRDFEVAGGGGGGTSRGAETGGTGGTALAGGLLGDFAAASSVKTSSSMLESRLCDLRASLCFAEDAMSVS